MTARYPTWDDARALLAAVLAFIGEPVAFAALMLSRADWKAAAAKIREFETLVRHRIMFEIAMIFVAPGGGPGFSDRWSDGGDGGGAAPLGATRRPPIFRRGGEASLTPGAAPPPPQRERKPAEPFRSAEPLARRLEAAMAVLADPVSWAARWAGRPDLAAKRETPKRRQRELTPREAVARAERRQAAYLRRMFNNSS